MVKQFGVRLNCYSFEVAVLSLGDVLIDVAFVGNEVTARAFDAPSEDAIQGVFGVHVDHDRLAFTESRLIPACTAW